MFTVEIKINGAIIALLTAHNEGNVEENNSEYAYEYYEPSVGFTGRAERDAHVKGTIRCKRSMGIRHVLSTILNDLDSK